jgi:inward rectifier potassium channel
VKNFRLELRLIGIDQISGLSGLNGWSKFLQVYYFSFQTFTTLGYGSISPSGDLSGFIASIEPMVGLISFAIVTGLLYGRFSRPTARFRYIKNAIIAPYQDGWSFQFRIANRRQIQLIELEAKLMLVFSETTNGNKQRKFFNFNLELNKLSFLPINWTLVHPMDENSPLFNKTPEELQKSDLEFLILIKGFDDTFSQVVHSRHSYIFHEIIWGAKFVRPFYSDEDGTTILDADLLDKYDEMSFDKLN